MKHLKIVISALAIIAIAIVLAWYFKPIKTDLLIPSANFTVMVVNDEGSYEQVDIDGKEEIYTLLSTYTCRRSSYAKPASVPEGAFNLMFDEGYAVFTEDEGYISFFDNGDYNIINYDGLIYSKISELSK